MKLTQTLAGSWVITIPNPEERHWETQLAEFNTDSTAEGTEARRILEEAAASLLAQLARSFPDLGASAQVLSHDPEAAARLKEACARHGLAVA